MGSQWTKDNVYRKAMRDGYRARSAYKLIDINEAMPLVNVVVCDASPHLSGAKAYDQARVMGLNEEALNFASTLLKQGGNLVMKSFQGSDFNDLLALVREKFYSVRVIRSTATRRGSAECYIVAKNFIGEGNDDRKRRE